MCPYVLLELIEDNYGDITAKTPEGLDSNQSIFLIITVVVGIALVLFATGYLGGGLSKSESQAKATVESAQLDCAQVCFRCCNGLSGFKDPNACSDPCDTKFTNLPRDKCPSSKIEIDNCNCQC